MIVEIIKGVAFLGVSTLLGYVGGSIIGEAISKIVYK